jgi:hypothetical protein
MIPGKEGNAINYGTGFINIFGNGHDIILYNDCNNNNNSFCNLGSTYEVPEGLTYNTDLAKNYMAGSYKFKVKEIEVFQVKFI